MAEERGLTKITASLVPPMWNMSSDGVKAVQRIKDRNDKSGVMRYYSSLPMKCKGKHKCIYKESCYLDGLEIEQKIDEVCPIEVELILSYLQKYVEEFQIEDINDPKNTTVVGLLKDLIDMELQIERANKRLMEDGDYLEDRVIAISDSGEKITNKEINQHINFKIKMQEKKAQILDLLHATPKSKAKQQDMKTFDPSTYAKEIMAKAREAGLLDGAQVVEANDVTEVVENNG
jgi:hypothetical protein